MQYLVTASEMKRCDQNTIDCFGVPSMVLMERAAMAVAVRIDEWKRNYIAARTLNVLVVCGGGNNGGDGVAIARILYHHGYKVQVALICDLEKCSDELKQQLSIAKAYGIPIDIFSKVCVSNSQLEWDIIVDALLGIGISRDLEGDYEKAVSYINDFHNSKKGSCLVISVDIPSGIDADSGRVCKIAVRADKTVTFNYAKLGHILFPGNDYVGRLYVEDVGITVDGFLGTRPNGFFFDETPDVLLSPRRKDGNKGTFGKVLVIAGSDKVSGALVLCCEAVLRAGAGMVKAFTDKNNLNALQYHLPEAMYDTYDSEYFEIDKDKMLENLYKSINWADLIVIGPGLGISDNSSLILKEVLRNCEKDVVLDADALNLISEDKELLKLAMSFKDRIGKNMILTPHIGEFKRLFSASFSNDLETSYIKTHILELTGKIADCFHCIVVCKDARTVVAKCDDEKRYINISGNNGMSTAGSGDVLAGILGAFCANQTDVFRLCCTGVYIHGMAGDRAAQELGEYSMTAGDILRVLPSVLP